MGKGKIPVEDRKGAKEKRERERERGGEEITRHNISLG